MTIAQDYVRELNRIANRYGSLEDETIKRMLSMLKDLRMKIAAQLATAQGWDAVHLERLRANVEAQIAQFEARLRSELQAAMQDAVQTGQDSVVQPFQEIGLRSNYHRFSSAQANAIVDFSARLVKQIADETRAKIDQQIRLAVLGDKSPLDAMKGITKDLGLDARTGVWKKRPDPVKGVAARSETILRTEMQRAFNLATYSQQQASARDIEGLTKSWMATADGRTRPTHLRAHMRYKNNPIPIDEPFQVGSARLMYPCDPNGPPEETINCRCRSVTHHPALGRVGSSLDGRVAAELARRTA